jgi:hypothetical protein
MKREGKSGKIGPRMEENGRVRMGGVEEAEGGMVEEGTPEGVEKEVEEAGVGG